MEPLSKKQTEVLAGLLDAPSMYLVVEALEELVAQYGYDESTEPGLVYQETTVSYEHRYVCSDKEVV